MIAIPRPPKYVESWPFGLYLWDLGRYLTYFGGLGSSNTSKSSNIVIVISIHTINEEPKGLNPKPTRFEGIFMSRVLLPQTLGPNS